MPTLIPYSLTFNGGLHLGELGSAGAFRHPFCRILDIWQRRGGDVSRFAGAVRRRSARSAFPADLGLPTCGQPALLSHAVDLFLLFLPATIRERGKELKRIRYISEGLLRKALQRKNFMEPG